MKDIKVLLGKRIRELRKRLNMSQQELSEKINIDQRSLSNIECGISFPTKTLDKIAQNLNVELPELFDFENQKIDILYMKKYIKDEIEYLNSENIKTIYKLIKSMK